MSCRPGAGWYAERPPENRARGRAYTGYRASQRCWETHSTWAAARAAVPADATNTQQSVPPVAQVDNLQQRLALAGGRAGGPLLALPEAAELLRDALGADLVG